MIAATPNEDVATIKESKIKAHVVKHKVAYSIAGAVSLAAIGVFAGHAIGTKVARTTVPNAKAVQDLTTNTLYPSQVEAAKDLGVDPSTVSKQLKSAAKTVKDHKLKALELTA